MGVGMHRMAVGVLLVLMSEGPGFAANAGESHDAVPTTELWMARYENQGTRDASPQAVAVSPDGTSVFVTGFAYGTGSSDCLTIGYDALSGTELWRRRYDDPAMRSDTATSIAVSPDGGTVFVSGYGDAGSGGVDYLTLAYVAATGVPLWGRGYQGSGGGNDIVRSIGVSPDGTAVFVTGESYGGQSVGYDYATVSYDAATSAFRWAQRYNGPGNWHDYATDLAVSPDGAALYITGFSSETEFDESYLTVTYDSTTGTELWKNRDQEGTEASSIGVTPDGYKVFVTGFRDVSTGQDFVTVAYDSVDGARLWVGYYNGPALADDLPVGLAVSADGSIVAVTGQSDGIFTGPDYATVAYATTTGQRQWAARYRRPGDDSPAAIAIGGSTVYVTGYREGPSGLDFATVGYDLSTGGGVLLVRYNDPGFGTDQATAIATSPDGGTVFVAGASEGRSGLQDFVTIAYAG